MQDLALRGIVVGVGVLLVGLATFFVVAPPAGLDGVARYALAAGLVGAAVLVVKIFLAPLGGLRGYGRLLRTGEPATATILKVADTGTTINQQPAFKFTLQVRRADGSTYQATCKQMVSRTSLGSVAPGLQVPVRVDPRRPSRVAIDSQGGPATRTIRLGGLPGAAGTAPAGGLTGIPGNVGGMVSGVVAGGVPAAAGGGGLPIANVYQGADVVREGVPATATVKSASLTGATAGQLMPDVDPAKADDPMAMLVLEVAADGGTVTAQGLHRVPREHIGHLVPGSTVPVAYLPANPGSATIDWERLARG